MLKQYLILALTLCSGSLVASHTAPEYPQFKERVMTALNDLYREKKKGHENRTDLQVVTEADLKGLIQKDPLLAEHIIDDLTQKQTEITSNLTKEPTNEQLQREAKKIAAHIETLKAFINEVAPAVDTSKHKVAKPSATAQQSAGAPDRPKVIVVVAALRPAPQPMLPVPEYVSPSYSNDIPGEGLLKVIQSDLIDKNFDKELLRAKLEATGIVNNTDKYPTSQSFPPQDVDAAFDRFRNRQAEESLDQLLSALKGTFKSTKVPLPSTAIVKIADYAQQDWVKPKPQHPRASAFHAPAGYNENAALAAALRESLKPAVPPSAERDLKEHPPAPANPSSAASYGVAPRPAARPLRAAQPELVSAQEQLEIDKALRRSLIETREREEKEREHKRFISQTTPAAHSAPRLRYYGDDIPSNPNTPAFVVPHAQGNQNGAPAQDLQPVLNRLKERIIWTGFAAAIGIFAGYLSTQYGSK